MEKDLLDISGEDEANWLLRDTPVKGAASFSGGREKSYLDCSPLQIPRSSRAVPPRHPFSSIGRVTGNNTSNMEQVSPCIDTGNVGKENTSGSKVELSVERQQMKKKKKGFNLRKSLAWDRAFSTEEGDLFSVYGFSFYSPVLVYGTKLCSIGLEPGVLDSTELSKITGNACLIGGDMLSAIQEEAMSASKFTNVSPGLQALEENLFNDLPVNSRRREKKIVIGTVPKPANVHTTTPRSREPSVSKVSKTKSDPVTVANNMTRITRSPSKPKLSQPTQSNNSQRSLGSVSFSKSTSSTKSKTSSSLASKSSIPKPSLKQPRRNVITKTSAVPSASKSQYSVVGKSNNGPMATSDVDMLGHASNVPDSDVTNMGSTLAQNNRVGNTQSVVSQLVKPSGLRLPSPSIGYFDQSDAQPSNSADEKHSQFPGSDVSSASRFSLIPTFKKPLFSKKVPRVNSTSATGNTGSSGPAAGFSAQERVKIGLKSTQKIESEVSSCSEGSQINESLQHPCIGPGDNCTSENFSAAKCEDFQSSSKLPLSRRSDEDTDEQRKTCCSVEGPLIKGSMDYPVQGPTGPSDDELTRLKVCNQGEEDVCTMNAFNGDLDTLDVHGKQQKECVHPGDEDEMSHFFSGEKDVLIVNHSTDNVAQQSEVLDSFTSHPDFLGDFASTKSDIDDISSESAVLDSIMCAHNMEYDGHAVLETEKRTEVSDSIATNCEADFVGPSPGCKDWFRESEEQHSSCQLGLERKERSPDIDGLARSEGAVTDDGPEMQIDYLTGSSAVEQNMEQVKLLMPSSAEVKMEDKSMESSHEPCSEKLISEKRMQDNCSSVASTSDVKAVHVMKQTDQLGTSDGCCPAKDVSATVFSYSNEELEDNSELEDMDLVTESDSSDEEPDGNLSLKQVNLVTESELICELDKFPIKGIPDQQYLELEAIHTAMDQCGKPKTLLSESIGSPASLSGDPESLNHDTIFSRSSEGRSSQDSNSGCIVYNYVGKAEVLTDTEKDFSTRVTGQEFVSHEEGEAQVIKISRDPVEYVIREEESVASISLNEAFSAKDDMQPNEFTALSDDTLTSESNVVLASEKDSSAQVTDQELGFYGEVEAQFKISPDPVVYVTREKEPVTPITMNEAFSGRDDVQPNDDNLTSENNGVHASDRSNDLTCSPEGKDKTILMDAKLEKKPDHIIVKPPNAVPFSDEWLAAIEAAGEEILTLKSGRVQHSPTDKTVPEPGPWSPICVWCWHHIVDMAEKDQIEGRCPACRTPYDKEKVVGMTVNCDSLASDGNMERKKAQKSKSKPSDGRKQLTSVRVIQRNLVYIVGLPLDLADEDLLHHKEYFGQYITYAKEEEAVRCIQAVHGFTLDGKSLKACFGTTKYCHAWLRNAACVNPDCLYLHEVGSQEDSFTKDEIISAHTRSRVQQITGATNLLQHRSGSMLPPPLDAFCSDSSSAKPIVNVPASQNAASVPRYSPPSGSGSSSRSTALPAGASWGSHIANQQSLETPVTSNGSSEIQRTTSVNGALAFSAVVANAAHGPVSTSDVLKRPSQIVVDKSKPRVLKPLERNAVVDSGSKKTTSPDRDPPSNRLSSSTDSSYDGRDLAKPSATVNSFDDTDEVVEEDPTVSNLSAVVSQMEITTNLRDERPDTAMAIGSKCDQGSIRQPGHEVSTSPHLEQCRVNSANTEEKAIPSETEVPYTKPEWDWRSDLQSQMQVSSKWDVDDISSLNTQRHHPEEESILSRFLSNSSSSILDSNRLASCSSLPSEHSGVNNSNLRFSSDSDRLHLPNRYGEQSMFSVERSLFANDGRNKVRNGEDDKIPNTLGLDFDPWDESLTSPNNLAELLGEVDQRSSALKPGNLLKQNNSQSRFSFARNQPLPESVVSRDIYRDNLGSVNGFASNYSGGLESFTASPSYSSYKAPVSRPQVSAPPGFSAPSRLPPPGFSSHERVGLSSDTATGTRFLDTASFMRNAYQSLPSVGNPSGASDIEFADPAILAVGRGMINTDLDMSSGFSSQMNSFGNETGLQMLRQQSLSGAQQQVNGFHHDLRNLSPSPTDPYGFSSRLMDHQTQGSSLSHFSQLQRQQPSANPILSNNGHWDKWNEGQSLNSIDMAELLRNERLGFNGSLYNNGYEEPRFRIPGPGDAYNRTYGM
ncbi:hypothetical protein Bca4012_011422 [Brassica carinata]